MCFQVQQALTTAESRKANDVLTVRYLFSSKNIKVTIKDTAFFKW